MGGKYRDIRFRWMDGTIELRSTWYFDWQDEIVAEWQATCDYASKEVD